MLDVAAQAGVSLKTVSRVINSEPGVTPAKVAQVKAAIVSLGYQRNDIAASLRRAARSRTVGLVIEDMANPFYAVVARAVEDVAQRHSSLLITTSAREDAERERQLVVALLRRRVDALLIVPAGKDHRYVAAAGAARYTVFLDRPPVDVHADAVLVDNATGAEQAVSHLLRHGHRRIAIVGDRQALYTASERLRGYRSALSAAGVATIPELVSMGHSTVTAASTAVARLLALPPQRRPSAIFAANNRCTVGALHALTVQREQIAVVGFDDFELADLLGITVVRTDPYQMGQVAAELALDHHPDGSKANRRIILPVDLVERGSGEIPA